MIYYEHYIHQGLRDCVLLKEFHTSNDVSIKRQSPIPLYFQVENILRSEILEGVFAPGDQIPTEVELCQRFKVSRSVIRPALQNLVQFGLIQRIPGKGTFVSKQKPIDPILPFGK